MVSQSLISLFRVLLFILFFKKKKSNNLNSTNVPKPLFVFHDYFFNMEYYIIYIPISHIY